MAAKRTSVSIDLEKLTLDEQNPRFARPKPQDEMLAEFAGSAKTLRLAAHIATYGVNPLDHLAVMPSGRHQQYVVPKAIGGSLR